MADSSRFDFCEKCGALSRDGQCQSCGYKDPKYVPPAPEASSSAQQQFNQQYQYNQQAGQQYNVQSQYTQQYNQQYNRQYGQYSPYATPKKSNGGVIAIIVIAIVILFMCLTCGVGAVMMALTTDITDKVTSMQYEYNYYDEDSYDDYYSDDYYSDDYYSDNYDDYSDDYYDENGNQIYPSQDVEGLESGKYYTELYSAIRDDLAYSVEMTEGYYAPENYEYVMVDIEYPIISGDVPNLEYINETLEYEYSYYLDYFAESYEPYMLQDSYYIIYATCYVTYMDENVMSVVFHEEVLLDNFSAINFYCLNFDMKNGVVLNNTELLDMDEEFAIDFRKREILENGYEALPDYTDQEILALLKDENYLVIFYTPMGMEVGLNLGSVVIYMTYSDYQNFLNQY